MKGWMAFCLFFFLGGWVFSQEPGKYKTRSLLIDEKLRFEVEIAESPEQQMLGLGNRDSLEEGKGMYFVYNGLGNRAFWMKGMRFSIDIIWIAHGKIIHIEHEVPPPSLISLKLPTYGSGFQADAVLEISAGLSRKNGIRIGSKIRFAD